MTKNEWVSIILWAETVTNEELELECEIAHAVLNSLRLHSGVMYEYGRDISDIKEREKYERQLAERAYLLELICRERGIDIWH